MAVITCIANLTKEQKHMCDAILTTLMQRNYPLNAPTIDSLRADLWVKVFENGWTTKKANPAPASLPKRTNDESGVFVGTLNEDAPIKTKGGAVPIHRRAGHPVMFKASFQANGQLAFFWIDEQGQKIPATSVDHDGDLSLEELKEIVADHYDSNELERVGKWNWTTVVYWCRARLLALCGQHQDDVQEDLSELQQIRLVEEWLDDAKDN
ncbi:uncharacterized protein CTRU02_212217 [Colletotrichum truncatum]|uniref:Uncharacterized protein n=1 Tax=Colletotrichum truncatum TaxID=5467 RepID=A0ACC3YMY3_COLTU|nr:uncharacterized protein CTRU02_06711 [Colletotrichum truncatum]KAF6792094.1 hypothetical protein CTRU02_06711 [Colletotrichum truncatum]